MLNLISILAVLSFSSCSIEGEQVCGVWNAQGEYGEMKLEITPWKGKFHGYLLEYKTAIETVKGGKEEAFIFLTDLVFEDGKYQNGKIHIDLNSEEYCTISLEILDENQMKATYDCNGELSEEIWTREGTVINSIAIPESNNDKTSAHTVSSEDSAKESTKDRMVESQPDSNSEKNVQKTDELKDEEYKTTRRSAFYITGAHQIVRYDDMKAMENTIEKLWTDIYENDFSGKLKNITDQEHIFVTYSDYDSNKGEMTITIGYKVRDLSSVPSGLKGVIIPTNDFLVYPISGDKSDYEGEEWKQLEELMAYRNADSADFEIYTFDSDYKVKKAEMWIATK